MVRKIGNVFKMGFRHLAIILSLLLASGCILNESSGNGIVVKAYNSNIWIVNNSNDPVYYTAFEQETLTLIDWAPCDNPAGCPRVLPDNSVILEPDSIFGYDAQGDVVVVYWWHLMPEPGDSSWQISDLSWKAVTP